MNPAVNRIYRFADCELRPVAPMLLRGGRPVDASSQSLALLRCLVERPGEVVDKPELLRRVWGHGYITDAAFARAILRTRQAVGDDGQAQRVIRTVHGRGVMLVAEVVVDELDPATPALAPATESKSETVPAAQPRQRRALPILALALAATALLALVTWAGLRGPSLSPDPPDAGAAGGERLMLLGEVEHAAGDPALAELALALPGVLELLLREDGIHALQAAEMVEGATGGEADGAGEQTQRRRLAGFSGADLVLDIELSRSAGGLVAGYAIGGSLERSGEAREPDPVALTRALVRRLRSELTGQTIDPMRDAGVLADPLLTELALRARTASARGDEAAAIRAYDAAIAMAPEVPRLVLERVRLGVAEGLPSAEASARLLALLDSPATTFSRLERADILHSAGLHAWYGGDPARAAGLLREALELAESIPAQLTATMARNSLAMAQHSAGELHQAWQNSSLAVAALREQQRPYYLSQALTTLGYFAEDRGRLDESGRLHGEALELRERYGFTQLTGASYYALARVARRQGELDEAERLIDLASARMLEVGQQLSNIDALEEKAEILLRQGRYDRALATLDEAERQVVVLNDELGLAWLRDVRGRVLLARGEVAGAVEMLRQSAETQARLGQAFEAAHTRIQLADALDASGDQAQAQSLRAELAAAEAELSHDQRTALAVVELRAQRRAGRLMAAAATCVQALELARTSGTADREAEAAIECGLAHHAAGDVAAAGRMLTLARRWNPDYPPLRELARALATAPAGPAR